MTQPTLPIGIDHFGELVRYRTSKGEPCLFADKSLLVEAFVDASEKVSLVTRPRRFGKTLNLSMLQHFFAAQVGGQPTAGLFERLKISAQPAIMAHQGRYPVLFLTLKAVRGNKLETCLTAFKRVIAECFKEHAWLLEQEGLMDEVDRTLFLKYRQQRATVEDYKISLRFLSQLLYAHHGEGVVILLDEYDTPVHDAVHYGYFSALKGFLAPMMHNTFKGNEALHKAMITGILKVGQASFFSELNNVGVHTMLHGSRYAPYFGFTQAETDLLLEQAGLAPQEAQLREVYNGYAVGQVTLYNPWSIVCFIEHALQLAPGEPIELALRPYWIHTGGTHLIQELLRRNFEELHEDLQALLEGQVLATMINEEVTFHPEQPYDSVNFWSLMLLAGYLKVVGRSTSLLGHPIYRVCFPNQEVKRAMEGVVMRVVPGEQIGLNPFVRAMEALVEGRVEALTSFLEAYLQAAPSYHDTQGRYKEQFFHGLLLGMTACLSRSYHIRSNRESGQGRYDLALRPKAKGRQGIVMEFKLAAAHQELAAVAKAACAQVRQRGYLQAMAEQGVERCLVLGLAFRGKQVALAQG